MSAADEIKRELAALHRGRGFRRPSLAHDLGPRLREVIRVENTAADELATDRLLDALREPLRLLPHDLRQVFTVAAGLTSDERLLEQRLQIVAKSIDRDVRTVRRRLGEANGKVADSLARELEAASSRNLGVPSGWYIEAMDSKLKLDQQQPEFIGRRAIRVTSPGIDSLVEMISVPRPATDQQSIAVEAVDGCELRSLERISASSWRMTLDLPHVINVGELHEYTLRVRMPSTGFISPYNVMVPLRRCRLFHAEVDFGNPARASLAWKLDGVPPAAAEDDSPSSVTYDPEETQVVHARFTGLLNGLAYGLRWRWAGTTH